MNDAERPNHRTLRAVMPIPTPARPIAFTGERLTSAISGQITSEHHHRYLLARGFCVGRDVLDIASGEGYGAALLAQVARNVVGLDIDTATMQAATTEFAGDCLRYLTADARYLPFADASFDIVTCFEALEHFDEQARFLAEVSRVLRPGGMLLISTPDREVYATHREAKNAFHVQELSHAEFRALLASYFVHIALATQRAVAGSVMSPEDAAGQVLSFESSDSGLFEMHEGMPHAPYLFALASNATLPKLNASVLVQYADIDGAERNMRAAIARAEVLSEQLRIRDADLAVARIALNAAVAAERASNGASLRQELDAKTAELRVALMRAEAASREALELTTRLADIRSREAALIARLARQHVREKALHNRSLRQRLRDAALRLRKLYPSVFGRSPTPQAARKPVRIAAPRLVMDNLAMMSLATKLRLPQAALPDVSVIIPSYGEVGITLRCLAAIAEAPPQASIEVLVAEDASGDPRVELLTRIPGLRLLQNPQNLGFRRNCNAAAALAKGRYLLFLNNDTAVKPGAIDALLATAEAAEAAAFSYPCDVDYCSGAAILVAAPLFAELGGFDELFVPAYYEDTDLAFRIRARGLKVL